MKKVTVLFLILIVVSANHLLAQNPDFLLEKEKIVQSLQADYNYAAFDANEEYLIWFEFYQSKVFIHDLISNTTKDIILKKGRGPGEYLSLTDMKLVDDKIFITDPRNNKLITIDINSGERGDIRLPSKSTYRFDALDGKLYLLENIKPKELISSYTLSSKENASFDNGRLNIQKEFDNPFFRDGFILADNNLVYYVTRYRPHIYIFDLEKRAFKNKIVYDESEVETSSVKESETGVKAFYPPAEVDVLTEDIALIPGKYNSIFILARGATDKREYHLDQLYEYSLKGKEFVGTHRIEEEATDIFSNKKSLFIYSEQDYKIYQYNLIRKN